MSFSKVHYNTDNFNPHQSFGHSMTLCGSKILIFGGTNGSEYFNDIFIYDLKKNSWTKPNTLNNDNKPSPRSQHIAAFQPPNSLLIFSGLCDNDIFNDLFIFDLESFIWESLNLQGTEIPSPRYGLTFVQLNTLLYCFAGF